MRCIETTFFCLVGLFTFAQERNSQPINTRPVNVLFIGNSYTYYNDLPQICVGIASSVGDVLVVDWSTPPGYTFQDHYSDSSTLRKIMTGPIDCDTSVLRKNWDFVVLQEQSQLPSDPADSVNRHVFPYAHKLDSIVHKYNPLAKTVFYMTWGRKDGDTSRCSYWPLVCTYNGMDSLLAMNYTKMAKAEHALVSPVGAVWKKLREKYPSIGLYDKDESHPSEAGSYAAACCFYTVIFRKDPTLVKFNYTLGPTIAAAIREVVKQVAYKQGSSD